MVEEVNILVRGIDSALNKRIAAAARQQRMSKQELIHALLAHSFPAPAVVVGWVEMDWIVEWRCPRCGRETRAIYVGYLPDGRCTTPQCEGCVSELERTRPETAEE